MSQIATIPRLGVDVIQEIRNPSTPAVRPLMPAVVIAPAYEVIEPVLDSGSMNPDALYQDDNGLSYQNFLAQTLYQTEFPGGHVSDSTHGETNVKAGQVQVLDDETRGWLLYGGVSSLRELSEYNTADKTHILRGYLTSHHVATRPFILGSVDLSAGGLVLNGSFLSVALDVQGSAYPHYFPTSNDGRDTVVTFSAGSEAGGTLSADDVVDQINSALGEVAFLYEDPSGAQYLAIVSPTWGVGGRVVIRDTGASAVLGFHSFGQGDLYVLGAGYRAKDDGDGDYYSPYVELYRGSSRVVGTSVQIGSVVAEPSSDMTDPDNYDIGGWQATASSFASTMYLKRGDEMVADGTSVGYLYQVQNSQLTMAKAVWGTTLADLAKTEFALQTHATAPWVPRWVYYNARNLSDAQTRTSTYAYLRSVNSGSAVWTDPAAAQTVSASNPTFPMAFGAGIQFKYAVVVDGVPQDERTHILSGTAANLADLVAALNTGSASGVSCAPALATYGELYAETATSNIRFKTGVVGTPKTGSQQQVTWISSDALALFDPAATPNIEANETYTGLGHYSLNRRAGNGSAYLHEGAIRSGVNATLSVVSTKKATIYSIEDNKPAQTLNIKLSGNFAAGSTPFSDATLQGLYNMAKALNGETQSSTSGQVLIDDVDGDTSLQDDSLSSHSSLVQWVFLGPDKYINLDGTETGTFTVGEAVTQAGTLASGVVVSRTVAGTTRLEISVDEGSPAFNLTGTLTGAGSGATLAGAPLTTLARLALHCAQEGASNMVRIEEHVSADALADSIGFTDLDTVRGEGIRIGSVFTFSLDENPQQFQVIATGEAVQNDSLGEQTYVFLETLVEQVNDAVGYEIASVYDASGAGNSKMQLASAKVGLPSTMKIDPQGDGGGNPGYVEWWCGASSIATTEMGLTFDEDGAESDQEDGLGAFMRGSGRPYPDFSVSESGGVVSVWVGSQIVRDVVSGVPMNNAYADLYLGYRGLRKDISPAHTDDGFGGLVEVSLTEDLSTYYGPINDKNPFGLAMYISLAHAGGRPVYGVGIDEVDADNPEGTIESWSRVTTHLKSKRVYAHAPIAEDRRIRDIVDAYVLSRSTPSSRGEAVVYHGLSIPTRYPNTVVASGLDANSVSTDMVTLESSVLPQLQRAGIQSLSSIDASKGVFIEFSGTNKRWSVQSVSSSGAGCVVTVRLSFTGSDNDDGFYATDALTTLTLVNADWSVLVRGALASTKAKQAESVALDAPTTVSRRVRHVVGGSLELPLGTTTQIVSMKYAPAVYATMASVLPPQQGFSNYPIKSFSRVLGTTDSFSEDEMDIMAGGGKSILVQPIPRGSISSRHQLTTDVSSVENREDSVTRILDYVSYFMRDELTPRTGVTNITPDYLDFISTVLHGRLERLIQLGIIVDGVLESISVAEDDPTEIYVDFSLTIPYPANRFRLTIAI